MSDELSRCLDRWLEISLENQRSQWERTGFVPNDPVLESRWITDQADAARGSLPAFYNDNSDLTPDELSKLASDVSPGGAHNGGLLIQLLRYSPDVLGLDPLLVAATLYHNWHGGKAGFQFLPDPASVGLDMYMDEVLALLEVFDELSGPTLYLVKDDRLFFDSLPDHFSIYRGAAGITEEAAANGLCWTTSRDIAEWFAIRSSEDNGGTPIVVTARIRKSNVRIAKASEKEIVTLPNRARTIKCRRTSLHPRPEFEWLPTHD